MRSTLWAQDQCQPAESDGLPSCRDGPDNSRGNRTSRARRARRVREGGFWIRRRKGAGSPQRPSAANWPGDRRAESLIRFGFSTREGARHWAPSRASGPSRPSCPARAPVCAFHRIVLLSPPGTGEKILRPAHGRLKGLRHGPASIYGGKCSWEICRFNTFVVELTTGRNRTSSGHRGDSPPRGM